MTEDREEWGGKGSISPEKTLKALSNNQSRVRERVIVRMVGAKIMDVMRSVKSVSNGEEEVRETGAKEILKVTEVEDGEEWGGRESTSISPEKTLKALFNTQTGVRERVMMEDREEWGGRGSISPEKTLKALSNNQSGVSRSQDGWSQEHGCHEVSQASQ